MVDSLKTVLPPVIGGLSAILVALLGFFFNRKLSRKKERSKYNEDKYNAFKNVWSLIEEKHILMRKNDLKPTDYNLIEKEINEVLIKNSLYLDEKDQTLFRDYIHVINKISNYISQNGSDTDRENWGKTRHYMPPEEIEIINFVKKEEELINEIKNRFKNIL